MMAEPHRVERISLPSLALGRALEATVLVPSAAPPAGGYPALYLLHGGFSHHAEWSEQVPLASILSRFPLLVVTPEAGSSMYVNGDDGRRFADAIAWDVPAAIEARYPVQRTREGRALAGLSMGGFGAMNLGLEHPERFAALGSLSGAFGMTWWNLGLRPGSPFLPSLGPEGSGVRAWYNPWRVLERAVARQEGRWPQIGLWVGTGDDPELVEANRHYHLSLSQFGIAHRYTEASGGHDWAYWRSVTPALLAFVGEALGVHPG